MPFRINLVEDDNNLNSVLKSYLENEGWQVNSFLNGAEAKKAIKDVPDLWVLDIMLPDVDGYQLLREIKAASSGTPVIFISARDADIDRVVGLELGSDDYLSKPFLPRELVIRIRKLLERLSKTRPQTTIADLYEINEESRVVKLGREVIDLTSKEFDLLAFFVNNQGQALSREQILNNIWGHCYYGTDRVVDDLIRRLRKKMPDLRIETMYGYGYRMVKS